VPLKTSTCTMAERSLKADGRWNSGGVIEPHRPQLMCIAIAQRRSVRELNPGWAAVGSSHSHCSEKPSPIGALGNRLTPGSLPGGTFTSPDLHGSIPAPRYQEPQSGFCESHAWLTCPYGPRKAVDLNVPVRLFPRPSRFFYTPPSGRCDPTGRRVSRRTRPQTPGMSRRAPRSSEPGAYVPDLEAVDSLLPRGTGGRAVPAEIAPFMVTPGAPNGRVRRTPLAATPKGPRPRASRFHARLPRTQVRPSRAANQRYSSSLGSWASELGRLRTCRFFLSVPT